MTSTQKLLKILEIANSEGGVTFLKIRVFLETLDEEAKQGSDLAVRFQQELTHILDVLQKVMDK